MNSFDVWECAARCEENGDIDGIIQDLEKYQQDNSNALLDLINERFNELVYLSQTLSQIKESTNEIKYPLMVLQKQTNEKIKGLKGKIESVVTELTEEQNRKEKEEKDRNEKKIMNCLRRLNTNLENAKSSYDIETACYQLEMLKYMIHQYNDANCVQEVTSLFSSLLYII